MPLKLANDKDSTEEKMFNKFWFHNLLWWCLLDSKLSCSWPILDKIHFLRVLSITHYFNLWIVNTPKSQIVQWFIKKNEISEFCNNIEQKINIFRWVPMTIWSSLSLTHLFEILLAMVLEQIESIMRNALESHIYMFVER